MGRRLFVTVVLVTAAACSAPLASSVPARAAGVPLVTGRAIAAGGSWGTAREIPGLGTLNVGGRAVAFSVSCASAGNCVAGGSYKDGSFHAQGFVVSETNGHWATAFEVPGLGTLNAGAAAVVSVSCASAGNCAAGGFYANVPHHQQGFVVSETNGHWGTAIEVPGLGALNTSGFAEVLSVSCATAGNCAAGGIYYGPERQAFVVSEQNGSWQNAIPVSLPPNMGGGRIASVSCGSAGNCVAGGSYFDLSGNTQGFVVSEQGGSWGAAEQVPGLAALNGRGFAEVLSVSCASAGNCAAGGFYADSADHGQGFVASEQNGTWRRAREVPGLGRLNTGGVASVESVSCATAGNCAAGGFYASSGHSQGFVAGEQNGTWGKAREVPGLATLNVGRNGSVTWVSCGSAGNCAAGGFYTDRFGHGQAFVASEHAGAWGKAIEVPGSAALNARGNAQVVALSCTSATECAAVGTYRDSSGRGQSFVVSKT